MQEKGSMCCVGFSRWCFKEERAMIRKLVRVLMAILPLWMSMGTVAAVAAPGWQERDPDPAYLEAVQKTAAMVMDADTQRLAETYGLHVVNVTWEDTGRYYNSAVGPNISDVTIQVQHQNPRSGDNDLTLMPVIRYPNFSDLSADMSPDRFYLLVGNEKGEAPVSISLSEYLSDLRRYLSNADSWAGDETSLMAERDTHVLVSAQAAFLPVPRNGKAEFNPVIFNYQSYRGDPAVLVIVATREGTSATIIDNVRDGFSSGYSWGQRLFFNQDGERASFTGERLSDFVADQGSSPATGEGAPAVANESGLNMVLLIQVPLLQKRPRVVEEALLSMAPVAVERSAADVTDVEAAVIGHGAVEGPFTEIDGSRIERDPNFPIRVTVQFYKATSNGVVSEADMAEIAGQIQRVYEDADYVGSLVVDGPSDRPTEHGGPKTQPEGWWEIFWARFEENTGLSREDAHALWRRLGFKARPWSPFQPR
jgi:hypothetical protein